MARISKIEPEAAGPELKTVFDHYQKVRGNVPNMFRTLAHRPEIMITLDAHLRAIMQTGTVSAKLKELVITRTSQINRCQY